MGVYSSYMGADKACQQKVRLIDGQAITVLNLSGTLR